MRHDWNSLLGNEACAPVTNRTTARFPSAAVLVEYLREFAQPQEAAGRIEYGAEVQRIKRWAKHEEGFLLKVRGAEGERTVGCRVLVMAHGLWTVNRPDIDGGEYLTGYEELPPSGESMEGQSVAIFGLGNSAFEVANAAADYANYVHVWPTRDKSWGYPHTSWESRYVGSLRAIRTATLDGYLLKSLDALPLNNQIVATKERLMIRPCADNQLCLFHLLPERPDVFVLSFHNLLDKDQVAALEELKAQSGIRVEMAPLPPGIAETVLDVQEPGGTTREHWLAMPGKALLVPREDVTNETIDAVMAWRRRTGDALARPYDLLVRAMGWRHNTSLYASSARPRLQHQRKYPQMTHEYESVNVPGMYFAGTLAHGKDWKRASGGFIHGFRYTARALHRILEAKYEGQPWPLSKDYAVPRETGDVARRILRRINEAAGPYQMFNTLGDGMVLVPPRDKASGWTLRYHEEMPVDYFSQLYAGHHRLMMFFGFDGQHRSLTDSIQRGTGFEPSVWYWPPNSTVAGTAAAAEEREIFRMIEQLHTDWSSDVFDFSLRRWLTAKIETVMGGGSRGHFDDHQHFDQPQRRATKDFRVVELDLTVVNRLSGDKSLRLFRNSGGDGGQQQSAAWKPVAELEPKAFKRLVSFDGERWAVEWRDANGKVGQEEWTLDFTDGIVQERHIEDQRPVPPPPPPVPAEPAPPRQEKEKGAEPLPPLAELLQLKARLLKAMCTERGLPSTGKRQELADRLHQHEQSRKEDGKAAKKAQRAREKEKEKEKGKEKEAEAQRQAEEAKARKKKRSPLEAFMKKQGGE